MEKGLVSIITCTGNRPEAFKLLEHYVARQTYHGPLQWIVVDDCDPRTVCTMGQEYVRGPKNWKPEINTQRLNMNAGMERVRGEFVLIMEDDDWYAARFIETMLFLLQRWEAVGEANNRYYALRDRSYRYWKNLEHASLCSSAWRASQLPLLEEAVNCAEHQWIDISYWQRAFQRGVDVALFWGTCLNVGMKQLPGRAGIGAGHRGVHANPLEKFERDPQFAKLREWVGQGDLDAYVKIAMGQDV